MKKLFLVLAFVTCLASTVFSAEPARTYELLMEGAYLKVPLALSVKWGPPDSIYGGNNVKFYGFAAIVTSRTNATQELGLCVVWKIVEQGGNGTIWKTVYYQSLLTNIPASVTITKHMFGGSPNLAIQQQLTVSAFKLEGYPQGHRWAAGELWIKNWWWEGTPRRSEGGRYEWDPRERNRRVGEAVSHPVEDEDAPFGMIRLRSLTITLPAGIPELHPTPLSDMNMTALPPFDIATAPQVPPSLRTQLIRVRDENDFEEDPRRPVPDIVDDLAIQEVKGK